MKTIITRWTLFLILGIPVQLLVMSIYPFLWLYWRAFIFKKGPFALPKHYSPTDPKIGRSTKLLGTLLDNDDDHGAFTQYGFIESKGLILLSDPAGNLKRAASATGKDNYDYVSGDCVVSWAFAYVLASEKDRLEKRVLRIAKTYLTYLGARSFDAVNAGWVSARCNNFGVNYCPDADFKGIGQPAFGPQFYTTSCILAIASKESYLMKVAFWMHWLLMGGWFWAFGPVILPKDDLWYIRDITMKALWVHREVFGDRWWISLPMQKINETVFTKNALFEAMLGEELMELPEVVHAFFSQEKDASSSKRLFDSNDRASAYIRGAIRNIYNKASRY